MMATQTESPAATSGAPRLLPLLLILFAGSGCSALIYEIVWFQLLALAIGSTAVSMGVLLATFMGGLCLGSAGLPRLRLGDKHPLWVYAVLEVGIAICGILVLFLIPLVDRVYWAGASEGLAGMLLRGLVAALCLLPPTFLMGASLPAIVRWIESSPRGVSWWGLLYGGNTVGAVLGCLLAGFYLLRLYNTATATYAAAAINLLVATVSFIWAAKTPGELPASAKSAGPATPAPNRWPVHVAIGFSGACALGAEVVWTRLMGMMLGSTVYVFSIILAVFLIGLAIGSGVGSWIMRGRGSAWAASALGWSQVILAACIAWTVYMIADVLPYWPSEALISGTPTQAFKVHLIRTLWAVLPPTLLWGASFPLACAAVASDGDDSGRVVGGIYAANTLGAIVGALGVSLMLVPWIGTQNTQRLLLLASVAAGLCVLIPIWLRTRSKSVLGWMSLSVVFAALLAYNVDAIPGKLIAYGRRMSVATGTVIMTAEGRNSSVAITRWPDGATEVDVNGHVEATTEPYDMRLQRMVGHLPAILHPNAKKILGIGFGAGVSAGTFTRYPGIESITVCEIEPIIPPISTRFFGEQDYNVLHNPKTRIVYDDARHFLLTTNEKYDIIASDPLDVFVKGTAALYTLEYFEAVKRHLNPGGKFTLYVPLYESDEKTVKSELATFLEAFPYGTVWQNTVNGEGYDMVFMGQLEPLQINVDEVQARMDRPDYAPVLESMREVAFPTAIHLFSTYGGQKADLAPWLVGAELNNDRDLRLQYLGGWGISSRLEDYLYRKMMSYRRPPVGMFTGSPQTLQALMAAMSQ